MENRPERRDIRISDSERDEVAAVLRDAAGEGRLDLEELDERLSAVYAAKTYADLEPITHDLPVHDRPATARIDRIDRSGGPAGAKVAVGILGGFERKGAWVVPEEMTAVAFWGGGQLDLRDARFAAPEVTIRVFAVMGGVQILVPEDAEVHVTGIGIMGGFDHRASGVGSSGAPRIVVTGLAFWGGVGVERKATDAELERRKLERKEERRRRKLERGGEI